jgi:hypothetical protein
MPRQELEVVMRGLRRTAGVSARIGVSTRWDKADGDLEGSRAVGDASLPDLWVRLRSAVEVSSSGFGRRFAEPAWPLVAGGDAAAPDWDAVCDDVAAAQEEEIYDAAGRYTRLISATVAEDLAIWTRWPVVWGPVSGTGAEWHPLWVFTDAATPAEEIAQVGTGELVAGVACRRYGGLWRWPDGSPYRSGYGYPVQVWIGHDGLVRRVSWETSPGLSDEGRARLVRAGQAPPPGTNAHRARWIAVDLWDFGVPVSRFVPDIDPLPRPPAEIVRRLPGLLNHALGTDTFPEAAVKDTVTGARESPPPPSSLADPSASG